MNEIITSDPYDTSNPIGYILWSQHKLLTVTRNPWKCVANYKVRYVGNPDLARITKALWNLFNNNGNIDSPCGARSIQIQFADTVNKNVYFSVCEGIGD
jgi:hypothetical protein